MAIECIVIIIILAIAGYMFVRSKRKAWFPGVFPLMVVPFVNLVFYPRRMELLPNGHMIRIAVYAVSFLAASLWILLWARKLPYGRSKLGYILCCIGFTFVLALVLLFKGASFA